MSPVTQLPHAAPEIGWQIARERCVPFGHRSCRHAHDVPNRQVRQLLRRLVARHSSAHVRARTREAASEASCAECQYTCIDNFARISHTSVHGSGNEGRAAADSGHPCAENRDPARGQSRGIGSVGVCARPSTLGFVRAVPENRRGLRGRWGVALRTCRTELLPRRVDARRLACRGLDAATGEPSPLCCQLRRGDGGVRLRPTFLGSTRMDAVG